MTLAWVLIAVALGWVAFAYAGYPALLAWIRRRAPLPAWSGGAAPPISVIIAVHNGAESIVRKLEETLALPYAGSREVIVASDASTDATDALVAGFGDPAVRLVRSEPRLGKEAAQAAAIDVARGEVLVFTDVSAELEPGALAELVAPFADASVGAVSSEDRVDSREGEGLYVRFEMWVRRLESQTTGLAGLSGSLFAARRELCTPWPADLASDFRTALEAACRGYRAVSAPGSRVRIGVTRGPRREWARKVRTVRRGLAVLSRYRRLLHPGAGRISLALWGHKVARFTAPFALLVALVASSVASASSDAARLLLAAQLLLYGSGAAAVAWEPLRGALLARVSAFFLLVNASIVVAWFHHLIGQRAVVWDPTKR